jgi:hypothetical protein
LEELGIKHLNDLFSLSGRVRDRIFVRLRPEPNIKRHIRQYIFWALRDANLHNRPNAIPVHTIYAMKAGQSTRSALDGLNGRLISLARRYRRALCLTPDVDDSSSTEGSISITPRLEYKPGCTFPVLIGFLVCGPIVALTTLDSSPTSHPDLALATCRLMCYFDMGEAGQDVWNALTVAIAIMHVRKHMAKMEEEGRDEWLWMIDDSVDPDTDADI